MLNICNKTDISNVNFSVQVDFQKLKKVSPKLEVDLCGRDKIQNEVVN